MKRFIFIFLILLGCLTGNTQSLKTYGKIYKGFKLAKNVKNEYVLANKYDAEVAALQDMNLDVNTIIEGIEKLSLVDKKLIVRVLLMTSDPKKKLIELLHMSTSYEDIADLVLKQAVNDLKKNKSNAELKALKKQKT